jgi:hypothetical protein
MSESLVEEETPDTGMRKHALHEWFEFYISVIKVSWNRSMELHLIGLEAKRR